MPPYMQNFSSKLHRFLFTSKYPIVDEKFSQTIPILYYRKVSS